MNVIIAEEYGTHSSRFVSLVETCVRENLGILNESAFPKEEPQSFHLKTACKEQKNETHNRKLTVEDEVHQRIQGARGPLVSKIFSKSYNFQTIFWKKNPIF